MAFRLGEGLGARPFAASVARAPLRAAVVAAALLSGVVHAAPLSFEQALALAEERAASLQARRSAVEGTQQARVAAGQLPDPQLAVGVENYPVSGPERFSWNRESMTMRRIGVMQEVPNAAKRAAQRDAAEAVAERERAMLEADRLAVRREAALAWLASHFAERKLTVFTVLERENQVLQDTLAARVAAGTAMPADALMARQETLELADRRDELRADVERAHAQLRRWTGELPDLSTHADAPTLRLDLARLLSGLDRHAELLAYAPMQAMARADVDEAEAMRRGDWGWEVTYANRDRAFGDMVSFQLTFELPVSRGTRQEPLIAARRKAVERLQAEREDALRRVRAEVDAQLAELQRLERTLQRQQGAALPLAQERAKVTLASYESGRTDLGAVLAARKSAAEAQLRGLDLQAQVMAQQARLAYLIAE
ncbi:TolC family protein [Aquabacterium sp. A7-Y]|uniref:TolC family protein n=1 Tax=Aquabacterium sp. A7-Y TaxID=1349605 RepID=UPI00223C9099|nr:TolC family protein [Aquabacterium sp. A7-Y]MCW7541444.1 TolC family protein [Aquabacterium sp. A7-Y]